METRCTKQSIDSLAHAYFFAKRYVIKNGYGDEIDWQERVCFENVDAEKFLREVAWVTLNSGMSEKVIARKFKQITNIFFDWDYRKIVLNQSDCEKQCLNVFNNARKVKAIIRSANLLGSLGLETVKDKVKNDGLSYLTIFPFIGEITKYHLAKNIGIHTAKPDRHLVRIASSIGINDSNYLCTLLSERLDEKVSVVDIVIWRYASLKREYIKDLERFIAKQEKEWIA